MQDKKREYKNIKEKECQWCKQQFETGNNSIKYCSRECFRFFRLEKSKEYRLSKEKDYICKFCKKVFRRWRERGGFCSQSCASKYHLNLGTFDTWRYKIQEKIGIYKKCEICNEEFYAQPHDFEIKKLCGKKKCKSIYMSQILRGENHPCYGKKITQECKDKYKKTMLERYGVTCSFALAKHRNLSRPQKEILGLLKEKFPDLSIYKEKRIGTFFVDIIVPSINYIIEFNGDYWHCNPRKYKYSYLNKKKNLTASEIWKLDRIRISKLRNFGYRVDVVWEEDFIKNKEKELEKLYEVICDRKKDQDLGTGRLSVNLNSAENKLGELLETSYSSTSHNKIGNDECDGLKIVGVEQSASKPLSRNSGEGSETTVSLNCY